MKKIILFLMPLAIICRLEGQLVSKNLSNETLDEHLQLLFNGLDDNVKGTIGQNGEKVVLRSTSETVNFNIYDFKANRKYIIEVFKLFETLSEINDDLEMLKAFSDPTFYNSFNKCDCRIVPLQVIDLYKKKYTSIKAVINSIEPLSPKTATITSREINALIEIISTKTNAIDEKGINKKIDSNKLNQIVAYISKDIIANNSSQIDDLISKMNQLKLKLSVYIATVNLLN